MKKGKFYCEILRLKKRKVKDKTKFLLVGCEFYRDITKELACYFAYKKGCELMGIKDFEPCILTETDTVYGYQDRWEEIIE